MQLQQRNATTKLDVMTDGARYLARELLRKPVKDAVKEALREEAASTAEKDGSGEMTFGAERQSGDSGGGSGGPSMGLLVLGLAAAAVAVYMVRNRGGGTEQSTWSEFDDQSASGMESSEYGRESDASESAGTAAGESGASTME